MCVEMNPLSRSDHVAFYGFFVATILFITRAYILLEYYDILIFLELMITPHRTLCTEVDLCLK